MLPALLLAASTTLLSLDDGELHLVVPTSVRVQQSKVNWETIEYDLYDQNGKESFLQIVAGAGHKTYTDTHTYVSMAGRRGNSRTLILAWWWWVNQDSTPSLYTGLNCLAHASLKRRIFCPR